MLNQNFTCQVAKQNVNNFSDSESNNYKKVFILKGKFYNACDFFIQKLYNVSDSDTKIHDVSDFESDTL